MAHALEEHVCCVLQMPSYEWVAAAGKKYSLLCVELVPPSLLPRGAVIRYFAYNVRNGTDVTVDLDTTLGAWRAPMPGRFGSSRSLCVHLLFEHATDLAFNRSAALEIAGSDTIIDLANFTVAAGLKTAKLVSSNWITVSYPVLLHAPLDLDRSEANLPDLCHLELCQIDGA
jgi:hypothetical protein